MASHHEKPCKKNTNEEEQQHSRDRTAMSPQEIEQYRATAQQNSMESIRAAEERYAKAKQSSAAALHETKEAVVHGLGATTIYLAGKGSQAAGYTAEKGKQGYEAAKETAFTASQKAGELAKQAAERAKDATLSTGETALDYAKTAGEKAKAKLPGATSNTVEKTGEVKDTAFEAGKNAKQAAGEKPVETVREETWEAKEKLGKQSEEDKQKMSKLSISEGEEESKKQSKGYENQDLTNKTAVGEIFETVGGTVIGVAQTAKEMVMGSATEKNE